MKENSNIEDKRTFWEKFFDFLGGGNTKEEEEKLDMQHDYDGINELDNDIPGWWNVAFIGTVVFAVVYLIRVFVTGGIPDQIDELRAEQSLAAIKIEEYLAKSGTNIDENTVVMLGEEGIANGKEIYELSCAVCHGEEGEGGIGPNLVDEYWLHGGSINDVFYSIKYGWPENGMIPWADLYSPTEIAEISSFIMSIQGTNPPNAKEPEGELYKAD